ncbi:MAG: fatty-acyl-CoA synthase [Solirubrobacteraceae bacterium]|jgi:fatty-acyl-CoA synthase|nr:fatty-acyl-CoA synthase [Solirubrobacteraceae bacterium]
MASAISDGVHIAGTLARAGLLRPSRPDRALRAISGLIRWGPGLASGYLGAAARYPHEPAIIDDLGTVTFAQVEAHSNAIARGLAGYGVGPGDGVAILCRNHRWFVKASLACAKLGANAIYLNTSFAGPQVSEVVARETSKAIVYDAEFAGAVAPAKVSQPGFVAWADAGADTGEAPTLQRLIDTRAADPLPPPPEPGRTVILTSGTTGSPKGANRAAPTSLQPVAAFLSAIPLHSRENTVIAAPLFHSWGFAHMIFGAGLASTLVLQRRFDPAQTLQAVEEHQATALIVVPVMLQRMLELPSETIARYDTSSLRVIGASGSALPGPLAQRVMDAFGDSLYNLYGSTEVAWATIASPPDLRAAPGTAGRPPRGTVVRILGTDSQEVPQGQTGRIFVGSELLFEGYTGGGDKARVGSLMATGDVGHFDAEGRLFVDGRDDDMIVSGGENVFPAEVEDLLAGVPGISEVAVLGVDDEEFGQRLRAYVVLAPGAELTEDELKEQVRGHLARYKVPRDVIFVDALPRNATGKILKRDLNRA